MVTYAPGEDRLPTYGAIGRWGIRGGGLHVDSRKMPLGLDHAYGFLPGTLYNLNCDDVIARGGGASGAHSDIAHAEFGHAWLEAILSLP